MKKKTPWKLCVLIFTCIYPWAVFAADITRGTIPSVSNPALIMQRFGKPLPPTHKKGVPTSEIEGQQPQMVQSAFEKIRFQLNKVKFKGNTVYTDSELQKIFDASLGHTISLGDLQQLVAEVTKKYRSEGYIISRAIL